MVTRVDNFFSVSNFKNSIKAMVRPNYFIAEFGGIPLFLQYDINNTFKFRCEKAEFPGKTLATNDDVGGGGTTLKLPYDVTYSDIQLSIICSEDKVERLFFDNWIDNIINPAGYDTTNSKDVAMTKSSFTSYDPKPGLVKYYENYAKGVTLSVKQLNAKAEVVMNFVMHDVYPISISAMNASWDETNSYQRFSVTLNYRYYTMPYVR